MPDRSTSSRELTPEQLDALSELVNIGFGKATSLVAKLVGSFISMKVPHVEPLTLELLPGRLASLTSSNPLNIVRQSFRPDFRGDHLLVVEDEALGVLHRVLELSPNARGERDDQDGLLEIANIVCGALIGKLSEVIGTRTSFSPPSLALWHEPAEKLLAGISKENDVCLLIHALFEVEEHPAFRGFVIILLSGDSMGWLAKTLDRFASGERM